MLLKSKKNLKMKISILTKTCRTKKKNIRIQILIQNHRFAENCLKSRAIKKNIRIQILIQNHRFIEN